MSRGGEALVVDRPPLPCARGREDTCVERSNNLEYCHAVNARRRIEGCQIFDVISPDLTFKCRKKKIFGMLFYLRRLRILRECDLLCCFDLFIAVKPMY